MQRRIVYKPRKLNKNIEKLINKATKEMQDETEKQYIAVHSAMTIALYRFWNYRKDRIAKIYRACEQVWDECGADKEMSMIRKCDEECDIELTNQEGTSYRNIQWLNDSKINEIHSDYEFLVFRQNQKKWTKAQMMASVCLSMHRAEGWGFKRLSELMIRIEDILEEYNYNPEKLCNVAHDECGSDYIQVAEVV